MKKLFLLIFIFTTVLYAEVAIVPIDKAKEIADRNAASLWGNVNPGEPIIYYSIDDNVLAYRFNYAINTQFLDKQTLINECNQGKLDNNRETQWGDGNYGNILMSARTDMPVNLEYGLGISSEYAYGAYIQEQAEDHLGSNCILKRIYYINGVNVWYHYTNGSNDIYIKPHSPAKVGNEQEFRSTADEFDFFCETGNFESEWEDYLDRQRTISRTVSEIPYHDECCPFYDWSYGCSPTAAAMLVAYWDHRSMYSTSNYSKFVDYHFERTDPLSGGSCTIDTHCPNVMEQLATAMNTNLATGGTARVDIAPGYTSVANTTNGYSFSASYHSGQTTTWYFNEVVSEINADRPLHISISGHSITGVGYNDVDETVSTHYTHQPWLVNITKSQLQATYPIIPGGAFGLGIEIEKPDGDQNYYGTGSGETLYAGDVYEITWDYDASTGSYVKLYYSTNHGVSGSWTSITANTPNDGVYDWVIPSGINSTACRIMIYVYSSGSVFWGADGSYGDFQIYSGGSLQTLYSDSKVNTTTDPDYYQFNNPYATWCAVGVRNNTVGENWSMRMYSDNTFTTELVSSTYTYPVDFVVLDRHHYSGINRGIKAYRFSGSNTASVEFEGDQETLIVGTNTTYIWTAGDVVEMFDVYLTPGIYSFDLNIISGSADLDFGLFGSTDAIYYKNRQAYLAQSINAGGAVDEFFTFNVTTTDYYGLCLWGNDANTSNYYVTIEKAGTWKGIVSTDWHNANNWSASTIPDATVDVTIPAGTPYSPRILNANASCNNISIAAGATLSIYNRTLDVSADLIADGQISMLQDNATINVMDDVVWNSGSSLNTAVNGSYINVYGDWNFENGTTVNPTQGYIDFRGTTDSWIRCYSDNSSFYRLRVYKSGGAKAIVSNLCTEDLVINGLTFITTGAIFENMSSNDIIMRGNFNYYGTFDFTQLSNTGSVIFDGVSQTINNYSSGSGIFNNVVFSSSTSATLVNEGITVAGDLTIEQGYFNPANYTVTVGGDWTNTIGPPGFTEGTGRVVFNSSNHQYCDGETFNILELNRSAMDFIIPNGTTTTCQQLDWTDYNGELEVDGGTFIANDLEESGLYGKYYITSSGGLLELHQDGGQYIDLNGRIVLDGGTMNIYGGSVNSVWPYAANATISMSGGVLDFKDRGIYIYDSSTYSLTETITGGTIRTSGYFTGNRTDFNPTGGTIELYGSIDASLSMGAGSNFYNVLVNKSSSDKIERKSKNKRRTMQDRDGSVIELTRSNTVYVASDLDINGDLLIDNGTFDLNGYTVNVADDVISYGGLIVDGILEVGDDLFLYSGSTVDLSGTFQIGTSAGWHGSAMHYTGSTFNQTAGNYYVESIVLQDGSQFNGTGGTTHMYVDGYAASNNVEIDDPDSYFYYFNVDSGASAALYNCSYDLTAYSAKSYGPLDINSYTMNPTFMDVYDVLTIDSGGTVNVTGNGPYIHNLGTLTMVAGSELNSASNIQFQTGSIENVSGGDIYLEESFTDQNNIFSPTGGSVTFDGSSTSSIIGPTAFYDLNIDKTGATVSSNAPFSMHDLVINSGVLDPGVNAIEVGGNWTNNVGASGFIEGTETVTFNGSNEADITTNETFYNLTVDKTIGGYLALEIMDNLTINVTNDLSINDGTLEMNDYSTLSVTNDVYINLDAGLNAGGFDTGLNLLIGGNWTNDNSGYDTIYGYTPGGETITFNGGTDQFITTLAPQEDFGNLVIDKTGGEFRSNDNIRVIYDLDILTGGWHDNVSSLTHYFEGDFYITAGTTAYWNSLTNNTVVFKGLNDQTVFNPYGYHYFRNIIVDKTEWPVRSFSNHEGTEATLSRIENVNLTSDVTENRAMTVSLTSSIDMQFGSGLTVEEGTLDLNGMSLYSMGNVTINDGGTLIVDEGASLKMNDGNTLGVNSGGTLEVLGVSGNLAGITHRSTGNYYFYVYSGGTISAEYGLFEYMTDNGVYVWNGGLVDPVNSFNYCTFQNGYVGPGTLLHINNADDVTITGVNFPDASSSQFNVAKTIDLGTGTITMVNYYGIFSGETYEYDPYNRINWGLSAIEDLTIQYNAGTNMIVLNWTYPVPVDQFNIYRSTDPYDFSGADVFTTPTVGYSEPATGTNYFYQVTAENISDNGGTRGKTGRSDSAPWDK